MVKKRYIFVMILVIGLSVAAVLRFGINPRPVDLMKPSFFKEPREIGAVTYRRLYDPLGRENLIVFGVTPAEPSHRQIIEGFLLTAAAENRPIHVVLKEPQLEALSAPAGTEVIEQQFNSEPAALVEQVRSYTSQGKRVLIYTASTLSSHMVPNNPVQRFEALWGKPVFAISTVGIALSAGQETRVDPPCVGSERDGQGTAKLGCAALLKTRALYRKRLDESRFVALMDQRGRSDLLMFVYVPRS
jgi:hypothetical protein